MSVHRKLLVILLFVASLIAVLHAQRPTGSIKGSVSESSGIRLHNATVLVVELGRRTQSDENGEFAFGNVPPGTYTLVVHSPGLGDERSQVTVASGGTATADFSLRIAPVREHVTVTASGREQTTFESFQSATSLESIDLAQRAHTSLGEVLEFEPGVAKRSFGPGSSRPVLRGFDGDRVLVMTDGVASGSLASQSGDHGESIDVLNVERLEVVRGPATLLYGSNAIGGVVNAITGRHESAEHTHTSVSGYATGVGGTTNDHGGISAGLNVPVKKWLLFGGGGAQRTGAYATPIGPVPNSGTRSGSAFGGIGWAGARTFFDIGLEYDNRRYGIPFATEFHADGEAEAIADEDVTLRMRRHQVKLTGGMRDLEGVVRSLSLIGSYVRYRHGEFEGGVPGTQFENDQVNYRASVDHKSWRRLSGTWGVSGLHRDYDAVGEEALAPPTSQNTFALFALETLDLEKLSFQFGGRFEHTGYTPEPTPEALLPTRGFDGASAAAGVRVPLWKGGMFVTNYTHSYRAPALEELFNRGPHIGNLAFEIGNPQLRRELADGVDITLRHQNDRLRADATFFLYGIKDFVFLAPTGNVVEGLMEAEYLQANARYTGGEILINAGLTENIWLVTGLDIVQAELREGVRSELTGASAGSDTPLPRIPPLRARVGFDMRLGGVSLRPQAVFADAQDRLFPTETRTAGYTVFNADASYTIAKAHSVHIFSVSGFNLGNRLYRNHLSLIKEFAPEIGRGVRLGYTVRFR